MSYDVKLTVANPLWNASPIYWLCLEGLCNQKTDYDWELVIIECPSEKWCGEEYIEPYKDKLKNAGCKRIIFQSTNERLPLGLKWRMLSDLSRGENFMLTAADNYSPSNRIQLSCENLKNGIRWFCSQDTLFYDIPSQSEAHLRVPVKNSGVWMCTKTDTVKRLSGNGPRKHLDHWMQKSFRIQPHEKIMIGDNTLKGIHTDGLNTISVSRYTLYRNTKPRRPFSPPEYSISDILAPDVEARLRSLADTYE